MPEVSGVNPTPPEAREIVQSTRDVAIEFGEYYAINFYGRHDPDKPHDRLVRREELMHSFPNFAPMIKRLDEDLENARGLMEGFDSSPLPRQDEIEDPRALPPQIRKIINGMYGRGTTGETRQTLINTTPPDYTFSGVRHPVARDLLDHLNIASLDPQSVDDPRQRPNALKTNGAEMLRQILGENYDPHAVITLKLTDVLTAVFNKRLSLPSIRTLAPVTEVESSLIESNTSK